MWLLTAVMFSASTTHYAITLWSPIRVYNQWSQFINTQTDWAFFTQPTEDYFADLEPELRKYGIARSSAHASTAALQTYIPVVNVSRIVRVVAIMSCRTESLMGFCVHVNLG